MPIQIFTTFKMTIDWECREMKNKGTKNEEF